VKAKVVLIFSLAIFAFSEISVAQGTDVDDSVPQAQAAFDTTEASEALKNALAMPSSMPRGPQEVLRDYESGMTQITQEFSARLESIAQAVQSGQLTREQAEKISTEQYQMAQMQFDLLSVWHEMLAQDLAHASAAQPPAPAQDDGAVMAALPFSSLQIDESMVQYLGLSAKQVKAIQGVMAEGHRKIDPLIAQLRSTRAELLAATDEHQPNENKVKALAAAQADTLGKVVVENMRLQARLYDTLTLAQQRKFDDLKRSNQTSLRAGN
jgi:Spy/CpxP family protein refolding chaperone